MGTPSHLSTHALWEPDAFLNYDTHKVNWWLTLSYIHSIHMWKKFLNNLIQLPLLELSCRWEPFPSAMCLLGAEDTEMSETCAPLHDFFLGKQLVILAISTQKI